MICKRCLLTDKNRNVSFKENGLCNFCTSYDKNKTVLTDFSGLNRALNQRIKKIKSTNHPKYDCIVPLSGGKDSSYILYKIRKTHGLRILAITCDNGFLNKDSIKNAEVLCKKLDVDHLYYKPDWNTVKRFYGAIFCEMGEICEGCMAIIWIYIFKFAINNRIPAVIIGESRDQIFGGAFTAHLGMVTDNYDNLIKNMPQQGFYWKSYYKKLFKMINNHVEKYFSKDSAIKEIFLFPFEKITKSQIPDILPYFFFKKYNEEKIIQTLETTGIWKNLKGHGLASHPDCSFHTLASIPINHIPHLSVFIREKTISRKKAAEDLLSKAIVFTSTDYYGLLYKLLKKLGLTLKDIKDKKWYKYWRIRRNLRLD